jgi:hypothetical protein
MESGRRPAFARGRFVASYGEVSPERPAAA